MKSGDILRKRAVVCMLAVLMLFSLALASCSEDKPDDSSMTRDLLNSYMNSLNSYNISGINKCCMAKLDGYDDSDEVSKGCRVFTSRVDWECENISIDGSSAIAQISLTIPGDFEEICTSALKDAVAQLEKDPKLNPASALHSALKKRAAGSATVEQSVEVSMTKVENKWYIVKSMGINRLISDIRTPVKGAYSILGY